MFKRYFLIAAMAAALAACGSNVKLDSDAGGSGSASGTAGADGQSTVTQVASQDLAGSGQGPAGVAKVIYFDFDRYDIKPEYQPVVDGHARFLKANASRSVVLEGNTDERGSREYNLALGQKRSDAVQRALTLLGVAANQVEAVSFGEENPADEGHNEAAYAKNRRVEFRYR